MPKRVTALVATALAAAVVNFFGVVYFFDPITAADSGGAPIVPSALGFLVYVLLSVALLDWASQRTGQPVGSGLVIGFSQIILVVDLTLRGERGLATGAAGAVLILITWTVMGMIYGKMLPDVGPTVDEAAGTV